MDDRRLGRRSMGRMEGWEVMGRKGIPRRFHLRWRDRLRLVLLRVLEGRVRISRSRVVMMGVRRAMGIIINHRIRPIRITACRGRPQWVVGMGSATSGHRPCSSSRITSLRPGLFLVTRRIWAPARGLRRLSGVGRQYTRIAKGVRREMGCRGRVSRISRARSMVHQTDIRHLSASGHSFSALFPPRRFSIQLGIRFDFYRSFVSLFRFYSLLIGSQSSPSSLLVSSQSTSVF